MENYVKAVLYAYPSLQGMEDAYAVHIKNKALLSCDGRMDTEKLAEYLAEEILRKRRLEWLKRVVEEALTSLSELERTLVGISFFGEKKKLRLTPKNPLRAGLDLKSWSERSRFRAQTRALHKMKAWLSRVGLTKEVFEKEFLQIDLIKRVYKRVLKSRRALHSSVS